jgi:hypothetical protein
VESAKRSVKPARDLDPDIPVIGRPRELREASDLVPFGVTKAVVALVEPSPELGDAVPRRRMGGKLSE